MRRHQPQPHLVGHEHRWFAAGGERVDHRVELCVERPRPLGGRRVPHREGVEPGGEPGAEAVDEQRLGAVAERGGQVGGLEHRPRRRTALAVRGDAIGPVGVVGGGSGGHIDDSAIRRRSRHGRLGRGALARAHPAGDENDASGQSQGDALSGTVDGVSHCASVPSKCLLR